MNAALSTFVVVVGFVCVCVEMAMPIILAKYTLEKLGVLLILSS